MSERPLFPGGHCLVGTQVPGGPGFDTLETLPVAFSSPEWQRWVLRSPPLDAVVSLHGEMAQCRHGPAICNSVSRRCRRGPSSTALEGGGERRD